MRVETSPEDIHGMHAAAGHPYSAWRHDQPCGGGRARHGPAMRLGAGAISHQCKAGNSPLSGAETFKRATSSPSTARPARFIVGEVGDQCASPSFPAISLNADGWADKYRRMLGAAPTPKRRMTQRLRAASAPKASAFAAPSTCSLKRRPDHRRARDDPRRGQDRAGEAALALNCLPMQRSGLRSDLPRVMSRIAGHGAAARSAAA